jgi:HEPN domain-containing protein
MNERLDPTDSRVWLARARSNLKLTEVGHQQGVFLEDLCFEAQQAAEKALKAICVHHSLDFPKTHSLVILIDILETAGLQVPPEIRAANILTSYAVQARYPGWGEEVTEAEYQHALELARRVVSWAASILEVDER